MSRKADRDALTDPDGKSRAYQEATPSVAKRLDAIQKRANRYLTKTVSTIIGDLKTAGVFSCGPRVCGGDPWTVRLPSTTSAWSPRVRG